MNLPAHFFDAQHEHQARVLGLVRAVDLLITGLPELHHANANLTQSWADLVSALALEPEPKVRSCPHCGAVGMAAATLCSSCWGHLNPASLVTSGGPQGPGGLAES